MTSYIGTKIISAEPCTNVYFHEVHANSDVIPGVTKDGYLVVYPDGYKSWSPKSVFEKAYRLVSNDEKELINS